MQTTFEYLPIIAGVHDIDIDEETIESFLETLQPLVKEYKDANDYGYQNHITGYQIVLVAEDYDLRIPIKALLSKYEVGGYDRNSRHNKLYLYSADERPDEHNMDLGYHFSRRANGISYSGYTPKQMADNFIKDYLAVDIIENPRTSQLAGELGNSYRDYYALKEYSDVDSLIHDIKESLESFAQVDGEQVRVPTFANNITEKFFDEDKSSLEATVGFLYDGQYQKETSSKECSTRGIWHIQAVYQTGNFRWVKFNEGDKYHSSVQYRLFSPQNDLYNYLDAGRYMFTRKQNSRSSTLTTIVEVLASDLDIPLPPDEEAVSKLVDYYTHRRTDTGVNQYDIADKSDLQRQIARYRSMKRKEEKKEKKKEKMKDRFEKKLDRLRERDETITINNVEYSKDQIKYQDQILQNDGEDWVYETLDSLYQSYRTEIADITFDYVLEEFIEDAYQNNRSGTIGEVHFNVTVEYRTNSNNVTSAWHHINGIRINKAEVTDCIEQGLCYESQDDYNAFLESVRKCPLKYHHYLYKGLDLSFRDPMTDDIYKIKLPISRYKNINYLELDGESYRISDTNRLLGLERKNHMNDVIDTLLDDDCVKGIDKENVVGVLKAGRRSYEEAVRKSKELLESTEDLFNIEVDQYELNNGSTVKGYKIEGDMREYIIEFDPDEDPREQSPTVYDYPSGNHRCIVDKSNDQVGVDKLINRIYALSNDSVVAREVNTLS